MRVKDESIESVPFYLKPFFSAQKKKYGAPLKPSQAWAQNPKAFLGISLLYGSLENPKALIEPEIRSMVLLRVSQINWCNFCMDFNLSSLIKRVSSQEKVDALPEWRDSDLFSEKERAVLYYTEAMTYTDREVDEDMASAVKKHYSEAAFIELSALVAFQNMSTKFNNALDIPVQGFCKI